MSGWFRFRLVGFVIRCEKWSGTQLPGNKVVFFFGLNTDVEALGIFGIRSSTVFTCPKNITNYPPKRPASLADCILIPMQPKAKRLFRLAHYRYFNHQTIDPILHSSLAQLLLHRHTSSLHLPTSDVRLYSWPRMPLRISMLRYPPGSTPQWPL